MGQGAGRLSSELRVSKKKTGKRDRWAGPGAIERLPTRRNLKRRKAPLSVELVLRFPLKAHPAGRARCCRFCGQDSARFFEVPTSNHGVALICELCVPGAAGPDGTATADVVFEGAYRVPKPRSAPEKTEAPEAYTRSAEEPETKRRRIVPQGQKVESNSGGNAKPQPQMKTKGLRIPRWPRRNKHAYRPVKIPSARGKRVNVEARCPACRKRRSEFWEFAVKKGFFRICRFCKAAAVEALRGRVDAMDHATLSGFEGSRRKH